MKKYVFAGLMTLPTLTSAFANSFYVALDENSGQCRIMITKPDGKLMRMLGADPYPTYEEAQDAIKEMPECTAIPGTPLNDAPQAGDILPPVWRR